MSNEEQYEKVVVVGIQTTETDSQFHYSLEELKQLVENAGGEVVGELTQKRERQDAKTVVGKGKLTELKHLSEELSATTISSLIKNFHLEMLEISKKK